MSTKKPRRMFVLAEFETTLTAKDLQRTLQQILTGENWHDGELDDLQGDCSVRAIALQQLDVNVAKPKRKKL
jgi:hypothetical protein